MLNLSFFQNPKEYDLNQKRHVVFSFSKYNNLVDNMF